MNFGKSVMAIRESRGISRKDFAEQLGIPYTTLRNYETDQREPGHKLLIKMASLLSVSVDELLGHHVDKKNTSSLSDEALKIAKDYYSLDKWGKRVVRSVVSDEKARCEAEKNKQTSDSVLECKILPLRCSTQSASAGTGCYLGPEEWETIYVLENDLTRRASFCVPVSGDSMEPKYHDGDILLVDRTANVERGQVGLYTLDGEGYVKIYGRDRLIPLNSNYPEIFLNEDTRCNGKVIGVLDPNWIIDE